MQTAETVGPHPTQRYTPRGALVEVALLPRPSPSMELVLEALEKTLALELPLAVQVAFFGTTLGALEETVLQTTVPLLEEALEGLALLEEEAGVTAMILQLEQTLLPVVMEGTAGLAEVGVLGFLKL